MAHLHLPQGMRAAIGATCLPLPVGSRLGDALSAALGEYPVLEQQLLPSGRLAPGMYLFCNRRPLPWDSAVRQTVESGDEVVIVQPLSGG